MKFPDSLPCPFCGHQGIDFAEGSTFRWLAYSCGGCGIGSETRVQTMGSGSPEAWRAAAELDALKTWNTRAAQSEAPQAKVLDEPQQVVTDAFGLDENGRLSTEPEAVAKRAELMGKKGESGRDAAREALSAKYNELLYAVANKHPGETRHETALRYIQKAEQSSGAATEPCKTPT